MRLVHLFLVVVEQVLHLPSLALLLPMLVAVAGEHILGLPVQYPVVLAVVVRVVRLVLMAVQVVEIQVVEVVRVLVLQALLAQAVQAS